MTPLLRRTLLSISCAALTVLAAPLGAYPLDAYPETGIRRVEGSRLAHEGIIRGRRQPPGALLPLRQVDIRLAGSNLPLKLPPPDPQFTAEVVSLLGPEASHYGIAVLDLSDPQHPHYAEYRGEITQNVGSVGKIVVALAIFQALADIYPHDIEARKRVLRESMITADAFIHHDHHTVHIWDPQTRNTTVRPLREGDRATLWEYLDWMLSASSNAAAAMVMKNAMLLCQFGNRYPVSDEEADRFFADTPRAELTALYRRCFVEPITRNGLSVNQLHQGSFFTHEGKRRVHGTGPSYASARELMRYVLALEEGRLVDEFSSREIKRLLYMTERRIRYASSPALADAAVYFKSGSLYSCKPEEGFICRKYHGNVKNYMNSVAIVESPAETRRLHYIVTLISNVLRKNSAVDHQTLATRIHRLIEKRVGLQPGQVADGHQSTAPDRGLVQ
jgi:hypothetical protein